MIAKNKFKDSETLKFVQYNWLNRSHKTKSVPLKLGQYSIIYQ